MTRPAAAPRSPQGGGAAWFNIDGTAVPPYKPVPNLGGSGS